MTICGLVRFRHGGATQAIGVLMLELDKRASFLKAIILGDV